MWKSRYVLTFWVLVLTFLLENSPIEANENVPVLIWGHTETIGSENPLKKTSQLEFEGILSKIRGGSQNRPIIVFNNENFCIEDVTQHKKDLIDLKDDGPVIYISMVNSPLSVIKKLPLYNESLEELPETIAQGQVIRTEATDLISAVSNFKKFKESNPDTIAIFTGETCSWNIHERARRAVDETKTSAEPIIVTGKILFYSIAMPTLTITREETISYKPVEVKPLEGNSTVGLEFVYSDNATNPTFASVILRLDEDSSAYYAGKAFFQDKDKNLVRLQTQTYFVFKKTFSYRCSGNVRFTQKRRVVKDEEFPGIDFVMSNFQIQRESKKEEQFGFAHDCVGFTSVPIWSGLFVTVILGLIMIWGLIMIMDIRTMDRFDDPKGKTITITASE